MIHRIRMARKRLGIARERFIAAMCIKNANDSRDNVRPWIYYTARARVWRRDDTLRAIERRKEHIA